MEVKNGKYSAKKNNKTAGEKYKRGNKAVNMQLYGKTYFLEENIQNEK